MRFYLRESVADYRFMATFTLGSTWTRDGAEFKNRVDRFLEDFMGLQASSAVTSKSSVGKPSAFWFLEFQDRGAPHIHIYYTDWVSWKLAATLWCHHMGMPPENVKTCSRLEAVRGGRAGFVRYACKYAAKKEQKVVPAGYSMVGRFWGVRGERRTVAATAVVTPAIAGAIMRMADEFYALSHVHVWDYPFIHGRTLWVSPQELDDEHMNLFRKKIVRETM